VVRSFSGQKTLAASTRSPFSFAGNSNLNSRMKLAYLLLAGSIVLGVSARAEDDTIEHVMKDGFKGKQSIAAKIGKGEASDAEKKKMAELVAKLVGTKAPKGDAKDWTERVTKLDAAAKAIASGKADAAELWKSAANCKACHTDHKPEEKK
jgi:lysozyme family protein